MAVQPVTKEQIVYPDTDGKPMAENTKQLEVIVTLYDNLSALFADREDVFVAADLLWYPVEGRPDIRTAPDAMVVFGRPKGHRGSYKGWEEGGVAPQVVFDVLSPGNRPSELIEKFLFYERYGVEEYYVYDPDRGILEGWIRSEGRLTPIPEMQGWVSPRLGVRFELEGKELVLYRPDGERFVPYVELRQRLEQERERSERLAQRLRELGIDSEQLE